MAVYFKAGFVNLKKASGASLRLGRGVVAEGKDFCGARRESSVSKKTERERATEGPTGRTLVDGQEPPEKENKLPGRNSFKIQ